MIDLVKQRVPKLSQIISLFDDAQVIFTYAFGSLGERPLSDIDIAVFLDPNLTKYQRHRRRLDLISKVEGFITPKKLDLVILNDISFSLAYEIIKTGVLIYNKSSVDKQYFEEKTIREYLDFKPFADKFNNWQAQAVLGIRNND